MKLIVLHGTGLVSINNKVEEYKKKFNSVSIIEINGKETNWNKTVIALSNSSLFSEDRLVILEEFPESITIEELPADDSLTVIIKFKKQLTKTSQVLRQAGEKKAQINLFNEEQDTQIFPFLDLLAEKRTTVFSQIDSLIGEYESSYLLTMIYYLYRRLQLPSRNVPDFVKKKIERQKNNFSPNELKRLHKLTLETEYKIKTGRIEAKTGVTLLIHSILKGSSVTGQL